MRIRHRREIILLILGDVACFIAALWLMLVLRYQDWPTSKVFLIHLKAFVTIFLIWILVFFIADLYRKQTIIFRQQLAQTIVSTELVNVFIAILFFYFFPVLGITPRLNIFLYLVLSTVLILWWRLSLVNYVYRRKRVKIAFLCDGPGVEELVSVINREPKYHLDIIHSLTLKEAIAAGAAILVINVYEPTGRQLQPELYRLMFDGVRVMPFHILYEEIFNRIPISSIDEEWFIDYLQNLQRPLYHVAKRLMDLVLAGALLLVSLLFYLPIILAIILETGRPIFFNEERIGRHGRTITITKFRSMTNDSDFNTRRVTRVGRWLRRTRLDELPQLLSVLYGDQSLVGPRPERPEYVEAYGQEIPYYNARHLVTPGLSGWAQLYQANHPHFRVSASATKEKLSYDLYYVKNRSLWLDVAIALKTIKTLVSRTGI